MNRMWIVALLTLGILASLSVQADELAQIADGLRMARAWCSGCHIVEPGKVGSDAAPPFTAIANSPKRTRANIEAWLHAPHPPMPQLNLSRPDIAALNDYIESLRNK